MSVGDWQPQPKPLTTLDLAQAKRAVTVLEGSENLIADYAAELDWLTPLANAEASAWRALADELSDEEREALIRVFTLLEKSQSWDLAAKSPVIPLFKALKKSKGLDRDLVQWVKANTDNKFLPFGPLL